MCVCVCVCVRQDKAGLNLEFSFCKTGYSTKGKELSQPNWLTIGNPETDGFMPFPQALMWSETQAVSSKIWTCITDSICYKYSRYSKHTLLKRCNSCLCSSCHKHNYSPHEDPNTISISFAYECKISEKNI